MGRFNSIYANRELVKMDNMPSLNYIQISFQLIDEESLT